MTEYTYIPAEPPSRPFQRGDKCRLIDSQGTDCGEVIIARIQAKTVRSKCGRTYLKEDGRWFADGRAWPFPWIRLSLNGGAQHGK